MQGLKRPKCLLTIFAMSFAATGCAGIEGPPPPPAFCSVATPIYPTGNDIDVMSDRLASDILLHNRIGRNLCGW